MITVDLRSGERMEPAEGLRVGFPLDSASGAASTATVLMELEPGAEVPLHTDSAEELLVVLEGVAEARVGDEEGRVHAGQMALVPSMAPHGLRNVGEGVLRVLGTFSASTVVSTFVEPFAGVDGPQVIVLGAPVPVAVPLAEPAAV